MGLLVFTIIVILVLAVCWFQKIDSDTDVEKVIIIAMLVVFVVCSLAISIAIK